MYFIRTASGAVKTNDGRYFKTGKKGSPDITCCIKGKFVGVEVKAPKGHQSSEQKIAEAKIKKLGGDYWLVRSIEDLIGKII